MLRGVDKIFPQSMSIADDPCSSSYEGPAAAHRLSFWDKKEKKKRNYNTLQRSII